MEQIQKETVKLEEVDILRVKLAQEMVRAAEAELELAKTRQSHLVTTLAMRYQRPGMVLVEVNGSELVFQRPELVIKPPSRLVHSDQDGLTMVNPPEV